MISYSAFETIVMWIVIVAMAVPIIMLISHRVKKKGINGVSFGNIGFGVMVAGLVGAIIYILTFGAAKSFTQDVYVVEKYEGQYSAEHFLTWEEIDFEGNDTGGIVVENKTVDTLVCLTLKCELEKVGDSNYKTFYVNNGTDGCERSMINPHSAIMCNNLYYRFTHIPDTIRIPIAEDDIQDLTVSVIDTPDSLFHRNKEYCKKINEGNAGSNNMWIAALILVILSGVVAAANHIILRKKLDKEFYEDTESIKQREDEQIERKGCNLDLDTTNGCGRRFCGSYRYSEGTYVTYYCRVLFYLPIWPIACYRVSNEDDNGYRVYGKLPMYKKEVLHLLVNSFVFVALFVAFIIALSCFRAMIR